MRISKHDVPVKIQAPGAVARQQTQFGDASPYGMMGGEVFSLAAGTDIAPLLEGLEHDACDSPHWGYLVQGKLTVSYTDGSREDVSGGDLFYWPPGHTLRVHEDAEIVLFSPQHEHGRVIEHVRSKLSS